MSVLKMTEDMASLVEGPQGPPGADGADGAVGPQGPAGTGIGQVTTIVAQAQYTSSVSRSCPAGSIVIGYGLSYTYSSSTLYCYCHLNGPTGITVETNGRSHCYCTATCLETSP